jgi:hypothetical protein
MGYYHVIPEEYSNCDQIHINHNASVEFLVVKIGLDST